MDIYYVVINDVCTSGDAPDWSVSVLGSYLKDIFINAAWWVSLGVVMHVSAMKTPPNR